MFARLRHDRRRGFSALEYSMLIIAVVIALLAVQNAMRRAINGKWKEAADSFGDGRQYEPGATSITVH